MSDLPHTIPHLDVTWDDVRARSERCDCFCFDCYVQWHSAARVPCEKHTLASERAPREAIFAALLRSHA